MKLTVAKKMALLAAAALIGIILLAGLGQYQMSSVFNAANYGNENTVPSIRTLSAAIEEFGRIRVRVYRLILNTDEKAMTKLEDDIRSSRESFEKSLKAYESMVSDDKDKTLLAEDRKLSAEYMLTLDQIITNVRAGKREQLQNQKQSAPLLRQN